MHFSRKVRFGVQLNASKMVEKGCPILSRPWAASEKDHICRRNKPLYTVFVQEDVTMEIQGGYILQRLLGYFAEKGGKSPVASGAFSLVFDGRSVLFGVQATCVVFSLVWVQRSF